MISVCLESQHDSLYFFNGRCDLFDWLQEWTWRFANKVYCEACFSLDYLREHEYFVADFVRMMKDEYNCYVDVIYNNEQVNIYCMEE